MPNHTPEPTRLLRLTQHPVAEGKYRVELRLEEPGALPLTAEAPVAVDIAPQDQENLRWYLEDYLQYPYDPAPVFAQMIEQRMAEIGTELFAKLFEANRDTTRLWSRLYDHLDETRVEVSTPVQEATALPWELLRDPQTDVPLALRARAFVRAQANPAQRPRVPKADKVIRILLVICRPGGGTDVPFRSVAGQLIKGLSEEARALFELDVLRPPTFAQLMKMLDEAKQEGKPYHVVHFDGHGVYTEGGATGGGFSPFIFGDHRMGKHGYLAFENPGQPGNMELVAGPVLGALLAERGGPLLVLNACRAAYAEPQPAPPTAAADDTHAQVRAFGSLAQEVMDAGVAGVVAMRYNVYVVTAAQFVAELYAALAAGLPLGEAVTRGRRQLQARPLRKVAGAAHELQDWMVPVVYEAAPLALFPRPRRAPKLNLTLAPAAATPGRGHLDPALPAPPDGGFWGRDETLLALDRAFDSQRVVLLHAYAGSGKTATAAEFARWYSLTGGLDGPVLFTSFEQPQPLPRVLDQIERVFGKALEGAGIHWLALSDDERRGVALDVLRQVPVLWIWDNVEPVAGFPTPEQATLTPDQQRELADFLRAAQGTRAKFLLTSRRDERAWLGDLPARRTLPPMPMQERQQMAEALAARAGQPFAGAAWQPLLTYTKGNPLTLTVVVGQALRDGLRTEQQIAAYVARLRAGEDAFTDDVQEGRGKSLGASLSYGFEHAFTEDEQRQLALLHFFQGFVDVDTLCMMGAPDTDWCLESVRELTREAGMALLDRAAGVGLLSALGHGYYRIHPALPWFFKALFDRQYATDPLQPAHAFVSAVGYLANYYHDQYEDGNRDVITVLAAEEANLLYVRQLAQINRWWSGVIHTMQGLREIYEHTGRWSEWARLVAENVPDFVDSATDGPLPGREEEWSLITDYRVRLARETRNWAEGERLQRALVDRFRQRAAPALAMPSDSLDSNGRNQMRSLATSLHELGEIQREQGKPECVQLYEETAALMHRIGDQPAEAGAVYNLGRAYTDLSTLRDLDQAEHLYRRSLDLRAEGDRLGQGNCLSQLGLVAYERFKEARTAGQGTETLAAHLATAANFYEQALQLDPPDAISELAVDHNQLGNIYDDAGDLERALTHYRESIRYKEAADNLYSAAQTRYNVALALARAGRFTEARLYAQAALHNYETYGDRAAAELQQTRELITLIEQALRLQGGNADE